MNIPELLFSIISVAIIGMISLRMKIVNSTGLIAAMFVGCSILLCGGTKWFLILLSFHFISAYFTKYKYEKKLKMKTAEAAGGARDWKNVLSNGVVASILAICYRLTSLKIFAASYLGVVSTAIADTLATELGILSPNEPRLITNPHVKVNAGVSGGVTFLGESAALFGGFVIALVALIVNFGDLSTSQIIIHSLLIGFLGCNFDSLLGATVQVIAKCQVCGQITEEKTHCEQPTRYSKGIKYIDNNMINFASTIFGAIFGFLSYSYTI